MPERVRIPQETRRVLEFFVAAKHGEWPVAIPGKVATMSISTGQGTFLARSSNRRARALAAVMAAHDAHMSVES